MESFPDPLQIARVFGSKEDPNLSHIPEWFIEAMKEYGRQIRNLTLDWAAKNGTAYLSEKLTWSDEFEPVAVLNEESILHGKVSKNLKI